MTSIKGQIVMALKEINKIGKSKRLYRINNEDYSNIHSIKYYKDVLDTSIQFGEFCKQRYKVKRLVDFKAEYYNVFLQEAERRGCSMGHLINLESHLLKLQSGITKLIETGKIGKVNFVPFIQGRNYLSSKREEPKDRSYSQEEIEMIKTNVSQSVKNAIDLSVKLGLRIRETCNIRVEHIVTDLSGEMRVSIPDRAPAEMRSPNDIRSGAGLTKGGRSREIQVPPSFESQLRELIKDKEGKNRIIDLKEGSLRSALKRSCERSGISSRGWHGFRHTYARERFKELMGKEQEEGIFIIKQMQNNQKSHLWVGKGISDHPFYSFTIEQINQVHSELGHGENRWGLMRVYLTF